MERYDQNTAQAALPTILRLGGLISPYGRPLTNDVGAANEYSKWQRTAYEGGVVLPADENLGIYARVIRRDVIAHLGVLAEMSVLGETAFMMPPTPHGQQLGMGHVVFVQTVGTHLEIAMNANYRMFTSGYADVKLTVGNMPDSAIRTHVAQVWGGLALDRVVELPEGDVELEPQQIGARQLRAVAEYIGELKATPKNNPRST